MYNMLVYDISGLRLCLICTDKIDVMYGVWISL